VTFTITAVRVRRLQLDADAPVFLDAHDEPLRRRQAGEESEREAEPRHGASAEGAHYEYGGWYVHRPTSDSA